MDNMTERLTIFDKSKRNKTVSQNFSRLRCQKKEVGDKSPASYDTVY